jgi:hypothetical protein
VHKRTQSHSWDAGRHPAHLAQVRFESQREQKSKAMLPVGREQTAPQKAGSRDWMVHSGASALHRLDIIGIMSIKIVGIPPKEQSHGHHDLYRR